MLILQVLDQKQDSLTMYKPKYFGPFEFTIPEVHFPLEDIANEDLCLAVRLSYICVEFAAGEDPEVDKPEVPFNVTGVESDRNETENESHLIKCVPFHLCGG